MKIKEELKQGKSFFWINPSYSDQGFARVEDYRPEIFQARERLNRFRPLIKKLFPETKKTDGWIESDLVALENYQNHLTHFKEAGKIYLKKDHELALAGSVKGRGGVYEVLKLAEQVALDHGFSKTDPYTDLSQPAYREIFNQYTIQVGSTGNLGLSIGMMSRALGFRACVHMSREAKAWKKELLRSKGAQVIEHEGDYSLAVAEGRRQALKSPKNFFIDDENSKDLFYGYALAGFYLQEQLDQAGIVVDQDHPLFVYLPCGVGGAPGGILYGLKMCLDHVYGFFMEPSQAPAMTLGLATGLHDKISVGDIGLSGQTIADGLAVNRPSSFIGPLMEPLLSGAFTVEEEAFLTYSKKLWDLEGIYIEPSAAASMEGVESMGSSAWKDFLQEQKLADKIQGAHHILWATGGSLVPETVRQRELGTKKWTDF